LGCTPARVESPTEYTTGRMSMHVKLLKRRRFSRQEPPFPNQVRYQAALHSDAKRCLGLRLLEGFAAKRKSGTNEL
jgi:hypothetical protein